MKAKQYFGKNHTMHIGKKRVPEEVSLAITAVIVVMLLFSGTVYWLNLNISSATQSIIVK